MSLVSTLAHAAKGAAAGVAVLTALPVFGAVGTITAAGVVLGSVAGAAAAIVDGIRGSTK